MTDARDLPAPTGRDPSGLPDREREAQPLWLLQLQLERDVLTRLLARADARTQRRLGVAEV